MLEPLSEVQEKPQKPVLLTAALLVVLIGLVALPLLVLSGGWRTVGAVLGFRPGSPPGIDAEVPAITRLIPGKGPELSLTPEYLSLALDLATLTRGDWWDKDNPSVDLENPRLMAAARALSPAFLRTGGTEADRMYYHSGGEQTGPEKPLPPGFSTVLTKEKWLQILAFSRDTGLPLVFTLNAGPGPRISGGRWDPRQAQALMTAASEAGHRVAVWELGNEVGAFWLFHGPGSQISPGDYIRDLKVLKELRDLRSPGSRILFQGSAFWPVEGETLGPLTGYWPRHIAQAGLWADILNWHFYPFQSRRSPVRTSPAQPDTFLDPVRLEETTRLGVEVENWARHGAPEKELWLGETGSAQAGGEPGLSDTFSSALWWADHLGRLARTGQRVVIRQTLAGGDYGLLDPETYAPRPDFWVSLVWKKLMGPLSLPVKESPSPWIRIYRHSPGPQTDFPVWLAVNLSEKYSTSLVWPGQELRNIWLFSGDSSDPSFLFINRAPADAPGGQTWRIPEPIKKYSLLLPPRSLAFVAESSP